MSIGTSKSPGPYKRRRIAIVKPGRKIRPLLVIGVLMLIVGLFALVTGNNASHSLAGEPRGSIGPGFTHATTWYVLGGVVTGLVGVPLVLVSVLSRKA